MVFTNFKRIDEGAKAEWNIHIEHKGESRKRRTKHLRFGIDT